MIKLLERLDDFVMEQCAQRFIDWSGYKPREVAKFCILGISLLLTYEAFENIAQPLISICFFVGSLNFIVLHFRIHMLGLIMWERLAWLSLAASVFPNVVIRLAHGDFQQWSSLAALVLMIVAIYVNNCRPPRPRRRRLPVGQLARAPL